ncbi:transposase [Planctomycetaceae bacterium SH139]
MAKRKEVSVSRKPRRTFSDEFEEEAVQMMLDGHSAASVAKNLGVGSTDLLYLWKAETLASSGPAAKMLDDQVSQLRDELQRTRRERDILKKLRQEAWRERIVIR